MVTMSRPRSGVVRDRSPHVAPHPVLLAPALAIGLLCAFPAFPVRAADQTPTRIGNVWGGFNHQPTEAQVQSAEQADSIAPDTAEQRREARIVQQLDQELLNGGDGSP